MNKNHKNIFTQIVALISTHPWLKFISSLLAVIIWFYVKGERI